MKVFTENEKSSEEINLFKAYSGYLVFCISATSFP